MEERRRHQRYTLPRGTFLIMRQKLDALKNHKKMSIGEISMVLYKSKSEMMAQVTNLGQGGVAFDGTVDDQVDFDRLEMDLLMAEKGLYIHNIPYSPLRADSIDKKKSGPIRENAFCFKELETEHQRQLNEMLSHGLIA